MKIKRAMVMLILVLAVLFTMSGCYGVNYEIEINENGGSVTQSLLMNNEAGEQQEQSSGDATEGIQMEDERFAFYQINDTTLQISLNELWAGDSDIAFTVRAKLPGSNAWIFAVLAVCAIAGIGGFVLYRKRRSSGQPQEAPETDSGEAEPQEKPEEALEEKAEESCEIS